MSLDRVVTPTASSRLKTGIEIETGQARAMALRRLHEESGFRYSIILNEGKKREVRLMFRAVSRQVLALKRVRVGNLTVDGLEEGDVRELTEQELAGIRRMVGMNKDNPKATSPSPQSTNKYRYPRVSRPSGRSDEHLREGRSSQKERPKRGQQSVHPGATQPTGSSRRRAKTYLSPRHKDNRGRNR